MIVQLDGWTKTPTDEQSTPDEHAIHAFRERLRGSLLQPGETGTPNAGTVSQPTSDRPPLLIASCQNIADVTAAVCLAREHHLRVSIQSGEPTSANKENTTLCIR